jgi:hypothetical protein
VVGSGGLSGTESSDRAVDADGGGVLVEVDHDPLDPLQVLRSGVVVEADAVADVEHRQRLCGVDRVDQLEPGVDGIGDRG